MFNNLISLIAAIALTFCCPPVAFAQTPGASTKSVTPDDVFAVMRAVNRTLDLTLRHQGVSMQRRLKSFEHDLAPMHVYHAALGALDQLYKFQVLHGLVPVPLVISRPGSHQPADVLELAELLRKNVYTANQSLGVRGEDSGFRTFVGKTPNDVFDEVLAITDKLNALSGRDQITPDSAYAQMARAVADARAILKRQDRFSRFRIDSPARVDGMAPRDVLGKCLEIRTHINALRSVLQLPVVAAPRLEVFDAVAPIDVYIQTQILIAEMNLLKMATGTGSATPVTIEVSGKAPSDVYHQAELLAYLVQQIRA